MPGPRRPVRGTTETRSGRGRAANQAQNPARAWAHPHWAEARGFQRARPRLANETTNDHLRRAIR
eukprot:3783775-Lingulodinium_polyedra.AAC.1